MSKIFEIALESSERIKAATNKGGTENRGSSLFASASSDHERRKDAAFKETALRFATIQVLCEKFNAAKIVLLLRKFGLAYQSVEEMLKIFVSEWNLTRKNMEMVNDLVLKFSEISPMQWKWVVPGKTVFPLVSVDKCEVPQERSGGI